MDGRLDSDSLQVCADLDRLNVNTEAVGVKLTLIAFRSGQFHMLDSTLSSKLSAWTCIWPNNPSPSELIGTF